MVDFEKFAVDEETNWSLTLRNCFQPDPNFAGKVGQFDVGVFSDKWNARRLAVPKRFIAEDGSLKLAELDEFISEVEGTDFKTFDFKLEDMVRNKAPNAKIRGPVKKVSWDVQNEHLPADDMPSARGNVFWSSPLIGHTNTILVRPSLQPSSKFGRRK